jgi:NAD(P)-dependent dehydrogenase (short-subunit alcohol dehydrogenase family)
MARIFITGSSDGLGLMAAALLTNQGHDVVLHARNPSRAEAARRALGAASAIAVGDVSTVDGMRSVAEQASQFGPFGAVIHNVAIGYRERERRLTSDGVERVFAINVLAPYVMTALIPRPPRLVYLSSGMHRQGEPDPTDFEWARRRWDGSGAYATSKLWDVALAFGIARRWPNVLSNSVEPGWVPTKMGGPSAPDDLSLAPITQAWLAVADDPGARVTARHFYHQAQREADSRARDERLQEALFAHCEELSGAPLPA